ncbi:unnamed protein product [Rotaria sordida]|uniref:Uncharacterized protein n=1 Tax=Rotaria sordida TaxID=392033 RepID=A0A819GZH8_9BILA|nr:unnamed protein product [Rotaria sordida]CAF3892014.1 unnamed protein product [Rotaria sordida]
MSFSNSIRTRLVLPNVDVFTFGESSLFGYDSLNKCLIVRSLIDLNITNDKLIDYLYLSLSPTSSIRRLILNQNETILALIDDNRAYLVYLPQSNNSSSKGSRLCPVNVIPLLPSNSTSINNSLIDFLWLSSNYIIIVYSKPSSSECHLYKVQPLKRDGIEYLQTFSVGLLSTKERTNSGTPNKRISLRQSSNIVKLDLVKRKQDLTSILIFAMKSDGDIFIMEIDQNQLVNNEKRLTSEFVGPICILPSTFDNYGADHSHSSLICLSCTPYPIVLFTSDECQINECIVLNPSIDQYYLFTIDSISLPINENNQIIKSIIIDELNSNIYYVCDSLSNIYSIEILWIDQIKEKQKQISSTNIQHLLKSNDLIQQIGLIKTNNKGQWLAIITKTQINQQKELILIRPRSLSSTSFTSIPIKSLPLTETIQTNKSNSSSEFIHHIRKILVRDQSLPNKILSSSSSSSATENISNSDFERNLFNLLQLISKQYIEKQEKVRIELENKQRYLYNCQQTQLIANQELSQKFQQIQQKFQTLNQQYQQEYARRKQLSSNVDDHLSIIEQNTPVVSDAEILMHQQLERYQIQINSLQEKIILLKQFITREESFHENQQRIDQSSMENINTFVQYYKKQINQMKQQLQTIDHDN